MIRRVWPMLARRLAFTSALSCFALAVLAQSMPSVKKGVGLAEGQGLGAAQLHALGVSWYYNWRNRSDVDTPAEFVPMAFGARSQVPAYSVVLLGFNEPDHPQQSNLSIDQALQLWPLLADRAGQLGAPAMAGNPVNGDWLPKFMDAHPRVDFVTLHWYEGPHAQRFMHDVQALRDRYRLPVWITEFAPSTAGQAREHPQRDTQQQVNAFIDTVLPWLEKNPCVARYAWHDAKTGASALWDERGQLTETGQRYATTR